MDNKRPKYGACGTQGVCRGSREVSESGQVVLELEDSMVPRPRMLPSATLVRTTAGGNMGTGRKESRRMMWKKKKMRKFPMGI